MIKPKSDLSLIINTRWASEFLIQALDSYEKYSDLENELIIIADNPSWQTLKVLQERKLHYYVVHFCNLDMADNYGAKQATRKYVGFINDDVFFGPHWDSVLMDLMNSKPHIMGSVYRLETPRNFSCGYDDKIGIQSFSEELFLKSLEDVKKLPISNGIGAPTCVPRKDFFECFGLTFHVGHGHGHERQLESRMLKKYPDFISPVTTKAGIYHFCSGGNRDKLLTFDLEEHKDLRDGLLLCLACGKKVWQVHDKKIAEEEREAWQRGYWLCPECKAKGETAKECWMPWTHFLP